MRLGGFSFEIVILLFYIQMYVRSLSATIHEAKIILEKPPYQFKMCSYAPVEHRGGENWSWQLQILIAKFDIHLFQWLFRYARLPRRLQSEKLSTLKEAKLSSSDSIAPWSKRVSNINIKILFKVVTWACYSVQYGGLLLLFTCWFIYGQLNKQFRIYSTCSKRFNLGILKPLKV